MKLGENLKKLRQNKDMTQEQLAEILGVSAQAISRWENETTYPDISLLPTIASFFEITVDELLGMEDFRSEKELNELIARIDENGRKGLIYDNILLLREAVKTYPTNYQLMFRLVNQLTFCQYREGKPLTDEETNELNYEAVEVSNRILSRCTDGEIINRTTEQLAYVYSRLGEKEKAVEYAKKLPDLSSCSTVILGDIYGGEQQKLHLQQAVKGYVSVLWCNLRNMADLEFKDENMTTAERIAIMQKALALLKLVFENEDYLGYSDTASTTHSIIAAMAMLEKDYELALSSIEKAAEFAIISDTLPERAQHTSLLVNRTYYNAHEMMKNYDYSNSKILYDKMQSDRYDPIRNEKRFATVLERIKEYC